MEEIFGVVRKSTIGEEIGKKRGVSEEDPISHKGQTNGSESIRYFNGQINKERYHLLLSLSPWKTNVPKFMSISRCEYLWIISKLKKNTKTGETYTNLYGNIFFQ